MILFDADFHEIGPATLEIDVEVGDSSASNDFELSTVLSDFSGFYIPGTEVGGIVEYRASVSNKAYTERLDLAGASFTVDHPSAIRQ